MFMQYAKDFTDALQFMWGEGFLSPGGPDEVAEMVAGIELTGKRVLDIGSGLGGVDILLATDHGAAEVIGIDVEPQLVESARALIAARGLTERVTFQLVEPGALPFSDASFDVVFSKDAMVHVEGKAALYAEVLRVLKPRGWFTAADWLWAEDAGKSAVVEAWLSMGPLKFAFTPPAVALQAMINAGFAEPRVTHVPGACTIQPQRDPGAGRAGAPAARSDRGRDDGQQPAGRRQRPARRIDSGDLIPSHLRGRRP